MTVDILSRKLATLASTNAASAVSASNKALTATAAINLFTNLASATIDASVSAIVTGGYRAAGSGGATYVCDTLATAQLAASYPHFCGASADGRYWRAATVDALVPVWAGGAIGWNSAAAMDTTTNHQPLIAEALGYQQAINASGLAFDKAHYAIWTPTRAATNDNINTSQSGIPFVINVPCEFRATAGGTAFHRRKADGSDPAIFSGTQFLSANAANNGNGIWWRGGMFLLKGLASAPTDYGTRAGLTLRGSWQILGGLTLSAQPGPVTAGTPVWPTLNANGTGRDSTDIAIRAEDNRYTGDINFDGTIHIEGFGGGLVSQIGSTHGSVYQRGLLELAQSDGTALTLGTSASATATTGTFKAESLRIYKCWQALSGNTGWGGRIGAAILEDCTSAGGLWAGSSDPNATGDGSSTAALGIDSLRVERSASFTAGRGNAISTALLIDTAARIGSTTANAYNVVIDSLTVRADRASVTTALSFAASTTGGTNNNCVRQMYCDQSPFGAANGFRVGASIDWGGTVGLGNAVTRVSGITDKALAQVPTNLGAIGAAATPVADQAGFQTMMTNIAASISAAPTGSLDYTQFQNGGQIEPGIYDAGGFVMTGNHAVRLVARVPGTVIIRVPAGQYFCTVTGRTNATVVDGITFVGGKGAFKFTNTGNNVNLMHHFTRCFFYNYTECAVANSANDHPMLIFRDNVLMGAAGSKTIGLAWGGLIDHAHIVNNIFQQNSYHLALGPRLSGRFHVRDNDFLSFGGIVTQADIWVKPNVTDAYGVNSGYGGVFDGNGFGNENINTAAPRFLIAAEDMTTTLAGVAAGSGDGRWNYAPSTTDTGFVSGLSILNSRIACATGMTSPLIQSNISNLRGLSWRNNKIDGGTHSYIVQFPANGSSDYTNTNSDFEFNPGDVEPGSAPAIRFSNANFAALRDYAGFFPGDPNAVAVHPAGDGPTLGILAVGISPALRLAVSGATLTKVADATGGTDFHQVTVTAVGQGLGMALGGNIPAAGSSIFVELALRQAASRTLSQVQIKVYNTVTNAVALNRTVSLPASTARFMSPVQVPASTSPGNWVLQVLAIGTVTGGSADQFVTGAWITNLGGSRIGAARALSRFPLLPRNQSMQGGAAGTWPLGWTYALANGMSGVGVTVAGSGSDANGYYVDIAMQGTVNYAGSVYIYPEPVKSVPAGSGQTWQFYVPMMVVSGTLNNVAVQTGSDGTTGNVAIDVALYTASGTYMLEYTTCGAASGSYAIIGTSDFGGFGASTSYIMPALRINFTLGQAIGGTLRVYTPTLRRLN